MRERYQKLPKELKDAMFAESTADKVFDIGKRYGLMIDKTGLMATEIGMLMLGYTRPNEFTKSLKDKLSISGEEASKIAHDINVEIFTPIRKHLRGLHGLSDSGPSTEEKKAPPAPPKIAPIQTEKDASPKSSPLFSDKLKKSGGDEAQELHIEEVGTTSFDDLKTELKREIESEPVKKSPEPKTPTPSPVKSAYKKEDPYREPIENEERTPQKESPPQAMRPFPKTILTPAAGKEGSKQTSSGFPGIQNTPKKPANPAPQPIPLEAGNKASPSLHSSNSNETSPPSNLPTDPTKEPRKDLHPPTPKPPSVHKENTLPPAPQTSTVPNKNVSSAPNSPLPKFRGFKMTPPPVRKTSPDTSLTKPAQQSDPAQSDPYRELIE